MKTKEDLQKDAELARLQLEKQGFYYVPLDNPFLYRGDERDPDFVFRTGFYRKNEQGEHELSSITAERESINCVACTKDLVYAVGFADVPAPIHERSIKENYKEYAWVYLLYAETGIDLGNDNLYISHHGCNKASWVTEVTLTGVPPENIIAAFQIKTSKNTIFPYLKFESFRLYDAQWQLLVTDFRENELCSLKSTNNEKYQKIVNNFFAEVRGKGYYRIPWSPVEEDKDFLVTHDLSEFQRAAFKLGLSKENSKRINNFYHVDALKLGIPLDRVLSAIKTREHLEAYKTGCSLDLLAKCTYSEAYGLARKLSFEQLHGLTTDQMDIMLLGFTRNDILSGKVGKDHIQAAKNGISIELLREASATQAYALSKNIRWETAKTITQLIQVHGLLAGFSLENVLSSWFDNLHVDAVNQYRYEPKDVINLSKVEVMGVLNLFSREVVSGLTKMEQLEGLKLGFSKNEVLSPYFNNCLFWAKNGLSISAIREAKLSEGGSFFSEKKTYSDSEDDCDEISSRLMDMLDR